MKIKIYKTANKHLETPDVLCIETKDLKEGLTEIARIPYKKHVLYDGECLPPNLVGVQIKKLK